MAKRPPLKEVKALFKAGIAIAGTVVDVAPAITDFDTSIIEVTDNHFNGGLLIFIDGPNAGQFHLVDVYTGAGGNCAFAVNDRWTDVPVNGNAFLLIPNAGAYLKKIFTAIAAIVADPWAVALPGAYGAGTGGNIVGNNLDAPVSGTAIPGDAMDLLAATIIAIRQSVCAGTDPASSIGKLLNDYLDAAVSSRASTTEVQTTTVAAGAGSNATLTRLGLLVRWITDILTTNLDTTVSSRAPGATALTNVTWTDALATALANYTAARAGYLDELAAANIPTDLANIIAYVDELEARLTAARAGYLDNLSAGAVALNADIVTLLARLTARRAGYLDNINQAGLLQVTAARAAFLDNLDALVSSRAPGATALTNATWTNALATSLSAYTAAKAAFIDIAISSRAPGATALTNATWTDALATALSAYTTAKAAFIDIAISSRSASGEALAALLTDSLDHIMSLADGASVFPASAVNDSVISKIIAKGDPATTNTYDNTTDSLEAISDKVTAIPTTPMLAANGALEIDLGNAQADTLKSTNAKLGNPATSLATQIAAIPTTAMRGTDNAMLAASYTAERGTDNAMLAASGARILCSMDFWSSVLESVVLTDVAAPGTNVALPDVVVDIPVGVTVVRAVAMFKFRMLGNTGAANALQGDQYIGLQKGGAGGYTNAIFLDDNMFGIGAALREGGDVVIGAVNLSALVTADDTYNVMWLASLVDVADLTFNDVQVGLRIWYSV